QGDVEAIYESRKSLANFFLNLYNHERAIFYLQEALEMARLQSSIRKLMVEATHNLGKAYMCCGRLEDALITFEQARKAAREDRNLEADRTTTLSLSDCYLRIALKLEGEGKYNEALGHYIECMRILNESCAGENLGDVQYRMGCTYQSTGNLTAAMKYLEDFLASSQQTGDNQGEAMAHAALAECLERQGDSHKALEHLDKFLKLTETSSGQLAEHARACCKIGQAHSKMGKLGAAVEFFEKHYNLVTSLA
ncbi:TPR-like protein, partial [Gonapodya prolifera JEL478]